MLESAFPDRSDGGVLATTLGFRYAGAMREEHCQSENAAYIADVDRTCIQAPLARALSGNSFPDHIFGLWQVGENSCLDCKRARGQRLAG